MSLTTRGNFIPAGKTPAPGEKRLFLLVEGESELAVKQAKQELMSLIVESTTEVFSRVNSAEPGRYSVV